MPTFLDLRTAQTNIAAPGTAIPVAPAAPLYVASIGLIVNNATNIRVDLQATIGVAQGAGNNTITVYLVRTSLAGLANFAAGTVVASQIFPIAAVTANDSFTITAADFNPAPTDGGQLTYELFVQASAANATLVGFQSLIGVAAAG